MSAKATIEHRPKGSNVDREIEMSLKCAAFEWACEQIEEAYKRKQIGKLTFTRKMQKLGFSVEYCRDWLKENQQLLT